MFLFAHPVCKEPLSYLAKRKRPYKIRKKW